jgi:protein-S-isoprenylcysteine O-methyltransferase Ste14
MAIVSLAMTAAFGVVAVGFRALLHRRRTHSSPFVSGAGLGWAAALAGNGIAFAAGPVVDLLHALPRVAHGPLIAASGVALAGTGLAATVWSQVVMGDAWRIGVDPAERTQLVTGGPFRWVRNPIYSAMVLFAVGLALIVPNLVAMVGILFVFLAADLHVRQVEEPHLTAAFGTDFTAYAGRVGRFVPGIGRLAPR